MKNKLENIFSHRCWDVLCKVRDVLKINVFIFGDNKNILIPPEKNRYGWRLLMDSSIGFNFFNKSNDSLFVRSQLYGKYFELKNCFNLYCMDIPVYFAGNIVGNIMIGPMIMNKRLSADKYAEMAEKFEVDGSALINDIHEIRVISNVMARSILELIDEIAINNVIISTAYGTDIQAVPVTDAAKCAGIDDNQNVSAGQRMVDLEGFLKNILKLANVECGSIMLFDRNKKELIIKAAKGLNTNVVGLGVKLGEGISGVAAKERRSFLIEEKNIDRVDNRIAHLLDRKDIKRSLVLPLIDDSVQGVLNLHTKKAGDLIDVNRDSINYFSKLFAKSLIS